MIACGSLFGVSQCPTDAIFRMARRSVSTLRDPVWETIETEAIVEADAEPLLRGRIEQDVLHRSSFGDGLAMMLTRSLNDSVSDSQKLYELFRDVIADSPRIAQSAAKDLLAIRADDPAVSSLLHPFLNFKGFHALQAYRISNALWSSDRQAMAYHIQSRVSEVLNVDIHPAAEIGSGVFIDHATGVVIGETAVVDDNVTILHGVTLGGTGNQSGDRHPKVGRGVFIGANAQLLGNIVVGQGSRIGASSVVLKSVDAHSTVAGIPARVVRRQAPPAVSLEALDAAQA